MRGLEHGPIWASKPEFPSTFTSSTVATTTPRSPPAAYTPAPASPVQPVRWSLTNRIFSLNLRSLYQGPPRQPASRLWNPVNSSPRALQIENPPPPPPLPPPVPAVAVAPQAQAAPREEYYPNLPIERDFGARDQARDEYPLLTLPERRLSRQSQVPSSLAVERSTGEDSACISGRTSIGLPRDRRSQPPTPRFAMASTADARDSASPVQHNDKDVEAGRNQPATLSRASLPTSHRTSMGSHDDDGDDDDDDDDAASEFPWGPSHPCFPHPNPHVPLDSELYNTTRIIRIKRDWMMKGDLAPTFANLYPEILDPLILEDDFRTLIKHINDMLIAAFDPFTFRACLDTVMGVATFWLWEDAGLTGVKKQLAELERWIEDWNRDVGVTEAVRIIPLRRTGYLTVRIRISFSHRAALTNILPARHPNTRSSSRPRYRHAPSNARRPKHCEPATKRTVPTVPHHTYSTG